MGQTTAFIGCVIGVVAIVAVCAIWVAIDRYNQTK